MKIHCTDWERIFLDGSAEEWAAMELHGASCAECGEKVRAWKALSVIAKEMREEPASPQLWNRIEGALQVQMARPRPRRLSWRVFDFWGKFSLGWQTAVATVLVFALAVAGGYLYMRRNPRDINVASGLLKTPALAEVERTERAYTEAIDKLAASAQAQLDSPTSPLMASYREKLLLLDGAIGELRTQAGLNPSNAHLRYQLLAMYQQKQETLQEVVETKP